MYQHACNYKVCLKTLFDLPLLRYFVLSLHGEQISSCLLTFRSGYVPLSLLMCLLRGLVFYCHCVACFRIYFLNKFEEGVIFVKTIRNKVAMVNQRGVLNTLYNYRHAAT
jgi:hypothetical protein